MQDYSQQTTGAAEINSWEEVAPLGNEDKQQFDCTFTELDNTLDHPQRLHDYDAMPLWPYPRSLPVAGQGVKEGQIVQTRTWDECLDLCKQTPGCVYVYRPGHCSYLDPAGSERKDTTWTCAETTQNYGLQCFMYSSYNAREDDGLDRARCTPIPSSSVDTRTETWDGSAECETALNQRKNTIWDSRDWCPGSNLVQAVEGSNVSLGVAGDAGSTYKHAVSSCANSKFQYSSYTFGHPDETTTGIS